MRRVVFSLLAVVASIVVLASVAAVAGVPTGDFLLHLAFGWLQFLARVATKVTINWSAVATALTCVVLIWAGFHAFLRWLYAAMQAHAPAEGPAPCVWKPRWTSAILGVVLLMFVAGISFIGVVHQTAWLATSKQPRFEMRVDSRLVSPSEGQLVQMGFAVQNYHEIGQQLPRPYGWRNKGRHSWLTVIMPFSLLTVDTIDLDLDWNDPKNAPSFQRVVPTFLNPDIAPFHNAEGYAVSHYAGNMHVLGNERIKNYSDVSDGTSNTLLAGEAATNFKAWGDPDNLRDASTGLNNHPDGFGGPSGGGALLLTMDGAVKFYSKNTSPKMLKALTHPNDGIVAKQ